MVRVDALALVMAMSVVVSSSTACSSHKKERTAKHEDVWVAFDDGSIADIDTAKNAVVGTVKVGTEPRAIVARDRFVYVVVGGGPDEEGVVVVDAHRRSVAKTVKVGREPSGVDVHGRDLLATNRDAARATAVDAASGRVHGVIDVGAEPGAVAFSPNGKTAWIASDTLVSIVDAKNDGTVAALDFGARSIAFSADGARAYLATNDGVKIFDAAAFMPMSDAIGHAVNGVAATDEGFVAVSDRSLDVVDATGNARTFPIGGLAVAVANGAAYVVDGKDVLVVDLASGHVVTRVHAGKGARHISVAR